jgi:CRISPR-associated protein Cas1
MISRQRIPRPLFNVELVLGLRIGETWQVNLMGNTQLSTQAIQSLCEAGKPLCQFSQVGWFYGITTGLDSKDIFLRRPQFWLEEEVVGFKLALARRLLAGEIGNQPIHLCDGRLSKV